MLNQPVVDSLNTLLGKIKKDSDSDNLSKRLESLQDSAYLIELISEEIRRVKQEFKEYLPIIDQIVQINSSFKDKNHTIWWPASSKLTEEINNLYDEIAE